MLSHQTETPFAMRPASASENSNPNSLEPWPYRYIGLHKPSASSQPGSSNHKESSSCNIDQKPRTFFTKPATTVARMVRNKSPERDRVMFIAWKVLMKEDTEPEAVVLSYNHHSITHAFEFEGQKHIIPKQLEGKTAYMLIWEMTDDMFDDYAYQFKGKWSAWYVPEGSFFYLAKQASGELPEQILVDYVDTPQVMKRDEWWFQRERHEIRTCIRETLSSVLGPMLLE